MDYKPFEKQTDWTPAVPDNKTYQGDPSLEAEEFHIDATPKKCDHIFYRRTPKEVQCYNCPGGWLDEGRFVIENGKLVSIKE